MGFKVILVSLAQLLPHYKTIKIALACSHSLPNDQKNRQYDGCEEDEHHCAPEEVGFPVETEAVDSWRLLGIDELRIDWVVRDLHLRIWDCRSAWVRFLVFLEARVLLRIILPRFSWLIEGLLRTSLLSGKPIGFRC